MPKRENALFSKVTTNDAENLGLMIFLVINSEKVITSPSKDLDPVLKTNDFLNFKPPNFRAASKGNDNHSVITTINELAQSPKSLQ